VTSSSTEESGCGGTSALLNRTTGCLYLRKHKRQVCARMCWMCCGVGDGACQLCILIIAVFEGMLQWGPQWSDEVHWRQRHFSNLSGQCG
jgi:hypothetical protein